MRNWFLIRSLILWINQDSTIQLLNYWGLEISGWLGFKVWSLISFSLGMEVSTLYSNVLKGLAQKKNPNDADSFD